MSKKKRAARLVNNVTEGSFPSRKPTIELVPKSRNQMEYIDHLLDDRKRIIFAVGPAGTGKTMLAMLAAIRAFKNGGANKIILTRPAVSTDDERHGFLPGDINQKMEPWTRPLFDILHEYYSPRSTARMLVEQQIELSPLAYMRGRTFKNAHIVADEMQNSTTNQMKMLLTRLGPNTKLIVTGDMDQKDVRRNNGLEHIIDRVENDPHESIGVVRFTPRDTQRDKIVEQVLTYY